MEMIFFFGSGTLYVKTSSDICSSKERHIPFVTGSLSLFAPEESGESAFNHVSISNNVVISSGFAIYIICVPLIIRGCRGIVLGNNLHGKSCTLCCITEIE